MDDSTNCSISGARIERRQTDLERASDEQLRVECDRRGMHPGTLKVPALTDDQLRAECERRGLARLNLFGLITERDEWRRVARDGIRAATTNDLLDELQRRGARNPPAGTERLTRELEEWKRRAEAAEAQLAEVTREHVEFLAQGATTLSPRTAAAIRESSPGIAATPPRDDGHYVDPLDLLCEDA